MRCSISIGTSAVLAAILTHGLVFSGVYLDQPSPISTYQGFFQQIALLTERLWSQAHGWQPMSHIRKFGQFYAPLVQLICPSIGFALFWLLSQYKVGLNFWKPVAIVSLLAIPTGYLAMVPVYALPAVEVARTLLVVSMMMWSVGAIRLRSFPPDPTRQPAPASP